MASRYYNMGLTNTQIIMLLLAIFSCVQVLYVCSFEFEVGDNDGWVVPPANDSKIYNDWASEKRFKVGDVIRFKYRKDSVIEVNETDYKKCNSTHPNFFSNTGNSIYTLDHPGLFYFMSGAFGHCERGQRMIVKVMSHEENSPAGGSARSSVGYRAASLSYGVFKLVGVQFALLYFASYVF